MAKKKTPPQPKEKISQQKKKRGSESNKRRSRESLNDRISRPHYINMGGADEIFHPVVDVSDSSFVPRPTALSFLLKQNMGAKKQGNLHQNI
eukprot:12655083-Ditylum_brightwellii.AAC.1